MNPTTQEGTRWSCRLVRVFGRGTGSAHVAHCEQCRRYFEAADQFDTALRRDARIQREPTPVGLDARILQALARDQKPMTSRRVSSFPTLAFGAAAVCAAITCWLVWSPNTRRDPAVDERSTKAAPTSIASLTELAPSVQSLVSEGSLQTEVDSVYADARSAARFLALNFLPATSRDVSPHSDSVVAPVGTG